MLDFEQLSSLPTLLLHSSISVQALLFCNSHKSLCALCVFFLVLNSNSVLSYKCKYLLAQRGGISSWPIKTALLKLISAQNLLCN